MSGAGSSRTSRDSGPRSPRAWRGCPPWCTRPRAPATGPRSCGARRPRGWGRTPRRRGEPRGRPPRWRASCRGGRTGGRRPGGRRGGRHPQPPRPGRRPPWPGSSSSSSPGCSRARPGGSRSCLQLKWNVIVGVVAMVRVVVGWGLELQTIHRLSQSRRRHCVA